MLSPTALMAHQSRHFYLLAALASLLLLGTVLHLRPIPQLAVAPPNVHTHSSKGGKHNPFEIEGLPLGPKFTRPSSSILDGDNVAWLMNELRSRFQSTTFPDGDGAPAYPNCTLNPARYAATALGPSQHQSHWGRNQRQAIVSFAINLHNSEDIIPAQAIALVDAIAHLLQNNKVYVSIYENSSKDKTRALLSDLGAALQAIGVDGLWMHSSNMLSDFGKQDRIVMLSEIRNLALAPLMPYASSDQSSGTLLVMNDVLTCSSDILELVHQQRLHHAGMAFGMDWGSCDRRIRQGEPGYLYEDDPRYNPDSIPHAQVSRFYDTWVGRGISGNGVYDFSRPGGFSPKSDNETWIIDAYSTENETVYQRWLDGRAFPVYSGWGGMSAFDASLFTIEHLRFRSTITAGWTGGSAVGALGSWGRLVSSEGYLQSDCPGASECEYVARDIWNMRQGRARIVLAPQARTTYNIKDWHVMSGHAPVTRREGPDLLNEDAIDWSEYAIPESVVCIPTRTMEGVWIDPWGETNHRTRVDPLWRPTNETVANSTITEISTVTEMEQEETTDEMSQLQQESLAEVDEEAEEGAGDNAGDEVDDEHKNDLFNLLTNSRRRLRR
jgi:hypothetical protein